MYEIELKGFNSPHKVRQSASSLEKASSLCLEYIKSNNIIEANWTGGHVYDKETIVAYISYNGDILTPTTEKIDPLKMEIAIHCLEFGQFPKHLQDQYNVNYKSIPDYKEVTNDLNDIREKAIQESSDNFGFEIDEHNFDNKAHMIGISYAKIIENKYRAIYFAKLLHKYYNSISEIK